ncbi:MAG: ATPase, T2SS/T4P/T4SS family [Haloferacaceae archaeon]
MKDEPGVVAGELVLDIESTIVGDVADAETETAAIEALSDELGVTSSEEILAALEHWGDADVERLIEAAAFWEDMNDLVEAVVEWDEEPVDATEAEFVVLDPATAHPTKIEVIRAVKAALAEGIPGAFEREPDEEFVETQFFDFSYLEGRIEIERYWVNEPFAFVTILYDPVDREYEYQVVEPMLDQFETYVREDLVTLLRNSLMYQDISESERDREEVFAERSHRLIEKHAATVDPGSLLKIHYYLTRDFIRFGPIDAMMHDPSIEDISCDGADVPVYVYNRGYRNLRSNVVFGERRLNSFAVQLAQRAGKQLSVSEPLVDASLPDGSRVQITLGGAISTRGSNFTIRKFSAVPITPVDLVAWNTFSAEEMAYFWLAIENNKSLIFAGGTGSGKTTSMNAVSFFIPPGSKLVTIEDTREIDLPHENWIQSVSRHGVGEQARGEISMYDLLQSALRQRPEYLVVGEIRTEQRVALTFFQAMSTGHTSYTTIHADSVETALSRLQNPPLTIPAQMLQELDIISIQRQSYIEDTRVRRTRSVTELFEDPADPNAIDTNEVFEWNPEHDAHDRVGESRVLSEIARERGWDEEELAHQLAQRVQVLDYMVDNDITDVEEVAGTIRMFSKDRQYVMDRIEAGDLDPSDFDVDVRFGPTEVLDRSAAVVEAEPDVEAPPDGATLEDLGEELDRIADSSSEFDFGEDRVTPRENGQSRRRDEAEPSRREEGTAPVSHLDESGSRSEDPVESVSDDRESASASDDRESASVSEDGASAPGEDDGASAPDEDGASASDDGVDGEERTATTPEGDGESAGESAGDEDER